MINKPIDQIEFSDLEQLKENAVAESRTIEYKSQLPGETDADKKEFLADVSAFANTDGGDLLYGISEESGVPTAIDGVEIADMDKAIAKYESIIQTGIEPRISVNVRGVETPQGKIVLLFDVKESSRLPHRVVYKGHDKFYARNSSGKYPLNTQQLGDAFNLSQTAKERMKKFRDDRISEITAGNIPSPVQLLDAPKVVLHIMPLASFNSDIVLDMQALVKRIKISRFPFPSPNSDGVVYYNVSLREACTDAYTQIFRNGVIESTLSVRWLIYAEKQIAGVSFAEEVLHLFADSLKSSKMIGLNSPVPVVVSLTTVGLKEYELIDGPNLRYPFLPKQVIDKDITSEKMILSHDEKLLDMLSPLLDILWQASGKIGVPADLKQRLEKQIT